MHLKYTPLGMSHTFNKIRLVTSLFPLVGRKTNVFKKTNKVCLCSIYLMVRHIQSPCTYAVSRFVLTMFRTNQETACLCLTIKYKPSLYILYYCSPLQSSYQLPDLFSQSSLLCKGQDTCHKNPGWLLLANATE